MPLTYDNKLQIKKQVESISNDLSDLSLKKTNRKLNFNISDMDEVFDMYTQIRDILKPIMKLKPTSIVRIDRHKVSAILTIVIIEKNFLKFTCDIKEANDIEKYSNIYLGFFLSKAIIKDFYEQDKSQQTKEDVPLLDNSDASYMKHFKKLIINNLSFLRLSFQDKDKISVILFLSHIFYHMEQNSILTTKEKNLQNQN